MKVSVVIPCYNVAPFLRRSLNSVFGQTHQDLEVICVDDGSTDDTPGTLQAIDREHPGRFKIITQQNNGACAARNTGLHLSSGEYIQFLDADDEILPEKIAHQVKVALKNGLPDIIAGSSQTYSAQGGLIRTVVQDTGPREPFKDVMLQRMNATSAMFWSRPALMAAGGWNEDLGSSQEYDLIFRMLKKGARVAYDDRILTHIHKRPGSITQTNLRENQIRSIQLRARVLEHVRSLGEKDLQPYHQALFDAIRMLYPMDRKAALEYYRSLIPSGFKPARSTATGTGYLLLHGLFGFDAANRMRTWTRSPLADGGRTTFGPAA